jgi:hypothetical protein
LRALRREEKRREEKRREEKRREERPASEGGPYNAEKRNPRAQPGMAVPQEWTAGI